MPDPLERLRQALEGYYRDEAREHVRRWRGAPDVDPPSVRAERHRWLVSDGALEAFGEATGLRMLQGDAQAALRAHLQRVRGAMEGAPERDRLVQLAESEVPLPAGMVTLGELVADLPTVEGPRRDAIGRALEGAAEGAAGWLYDGRARVASMQDDGSHPDAGPAFDDLVVHAKAMLAASDEAAREAVHALVGASRHRVPQLGDLLHALRATDLDGLFPPRERWRRVAADVSALGFERELSARVRVEPDHRGLDPRVRLAAVDVPRDLRLAPAPAEHGLLSEIAAADGLGRALALCLTAPGLPVELRRPVEGSVPGTLGTLFAQVLAEPPALVRLRGMGRRESERVARLAGAALLLESRLRAAEVILVAGAGASLQAMREQAPDVLRRALAIEVPPPLAVLVGGTRRGVAARYRGRVGGLAAWHALRERFDEDWYRNPRAEEPIRAGAHGGAWLSAESWVTEELGANEDAPRLRLRELAGR
ncbi:MAG: hypothetical protein ACOC9O_02895 [Myxococcota bacterium]